MTPEKNERFIWFENGYGQTALKLGIISTSMFEKFIAYKIYLNMRDSGKGHMEAIKLISDLGHGSESNVYKAVSFFVNYKNDKPI